MSEQSNMKNSPTYAELQTMKDEPTTAVMTRQEANPMSLIQIAVESNADPDRLEKLFALQERYERNRAAEAFADALAKFQAECPPIFKGRNGAHGAKFAGFDDIMARIRPVLAKCGLSVSFDTKHTDAKNITCHCIIKHGIHEHRTEFTCPVATDLKANDSQKYGSALSYVKRYSLCAALNLVVTDEDDDGNKGGSDFIGDGQKAEIHRLLTESKADVAAFLEWLQVDDIATIPTSKYGEAVAKLKLKISKNGGGK